MQRRSFLGFLAALPFLPKLLGKREAPKESALPFESFDLELEPDPCTFAGQPTLATPTWTSGTYSDAVTYRADFAPPVFVNEIPEGIYYTDPDGFRRYAGGSWTQCDAPATSEPLG